MQSRWPRWCAYALAMVMAVSVAAAVPDRAEAAKPSWVGLPKDRSVPGTKAKLAPLPVGDPAAAPVAALPAPRWPVAGSATVTLPDPPAEPAGAKGAAGVPAATGGTVQARAAVRAGGLPVWVAPSAPKAGTKPAAAAGKVAGPRRVRVEVLGHDATERVGVHGVAVRLAAEQGSGPAALSVDYGAFAGAFGGDWATRLRFVSLPECALSTPDRPECRAGDPIPTRNDVRAKRVTADVGTAATPAVYVLTAGASGPGGNYSATALSQSATWQVSPQTGDFSWSYDLDMPPGLNGPVPDLGLSYSSQGVDGRTASTNNQPSWVGEGFDLWSGYIERSYVPCEDDGSGSTPKRGDLCYAYDNATMSLNGSATELIPDGTGKYRPKNDDGSRIEHLTGATNYVKNGEYWKVTTPDGIQYYFGRNRLPNWVSGNPETNSAWDVPVYSNNPGEPCYNATFASASCPMGWRWNLDYVVDPRGNAEAFFYNKETNYYARNKSTSTAYTRGGYLTEARYGLRDSAPYAQAPMRVSFEVAERCKPSGTITCSEAQFTAANANYWPDTPVDQNCKSGATCNMIAPSFWSRKRLIAVHTQVWGGAQYRPVDTWTLRQDFLDNDASTPSLWLDGITHKGERDPKNAGATESLPEVTFAPKQLPNRVDGQEGIPPFVRNRVLSVTSESGGVLSVTYSEQDCAVGALPTPETNTTRCYPTFWTKDGDTSATRDWFNKYVVTQIVSDDRIDGSPDDVTTYDYLSTPGWHFADDDGLVKEKEKTWSQWRGYEMVRVREGAAGTQQTETQYQYFRGMNGDRLTPTGGTRSVFVTDSEGKDTAIPDDPQLQGFLREEIERNGPDGAEVSGTINDPWVHGPTATRVRNWGTTSAYVVETGRIHSRVTFAGGGVRRTEEATDYTPEGLPTQVDDLGDLAVPDDQSCTRTSYARNDTDWLVSLASRVQTASVDCSVNSVRTNQVVSDERVSYDSQAFGVPPTKALPTSAEELTDDGTYATSDRASYDAYGREIEAYDGMNHRTTTDYTPATGGPVTKVVVTGWLSSTVGYTNTTELDPGSGQALASIDTNSRRTDFGYDPLARLTQVWQPGRTMGQQSASEEFSYLTSKDGPTVVTTRQLRNDGSGYNVSYDLYDGLLRERQSQDPAPGGGRLISSTDYDSRGEVAQQTDPYYDPAEPGTDLMVSPDSAVPGLHVVNYDGAGRTTNSIFLVLGIEKWRSTATYLGNGVTVDPPDGETPTTTIVDAEGNTTELRQYQGDSPTGGYDTTRYTYESGGQLSSVTDPAGNVTRYTYDLRGRLVKLEDPNAGTMVRTYDDNDNISMTTDGRGRSVTYKYDALDRITGTWEGGTQLTGYTYDTILKGMPSSATRYADGGAYTSTVTGYNEANLPTGNDVTIPASEGFAVTSYGFTYSYNLDGSMASMTYPAAGGLPGEKVRYSYNELGMPTTLDGTTPAGNTSYVTQTSYSKLGERIRNVLSTGAKSAVRTFAYEEGTRRLSHVITEVEGASQQRVADVSYGYDKAGNVRKIADAPPGQAADTQCFGYDYLRRLSEAWTPNSGDCNATPSATALSGPAPYWQSYRYDAAGNRTKEIRHAAGGDTTRTYTYPTPGGSLPNALASVQTVDPAGAAHTDTFGYDKSGNTNKRVVDGATQLLDWTAEGNLAKVTEGSKVTSYVYDTDGERLIRHDPTGTTLYLGAMELRRENGNETAVRYYEQNGDAVAVRTPTAVSFLFDDHHGTDELAVDATTMAVTRRRYDPFGAARGPQPSSWPGERSFVGGDADPSTGLVHLGAREYDPAVGRFISPDPVVDVSDPQQMNSYAYANNSPETYSDPDGLWFGSSVWKKARAAAERAWRAYQARLRAYRAWLAWKARQALQRARELARRLAKLALQRARRVAKNLARRLHKYLFGNKHKKVRSKPSSHPAKRHVRTPKTTNTRVVNRHTRHQGPGLLDRAKSFAKKAVAVVGAGVAAVAAGVDAAGSAVAGAAGAVAGGAGAAAGVIGTGAGAFSPALYRTLADGTKMSDKTLTLIFRKAGDGVLEFVVPRGFRLAGKVPAVFDLPESGARIVTEELAEEMLKGRLQKAIQGLSDLYDDIVDHWQPPTHHGGPHF
jgi:RHS repeat-associated protein